MDILVTGGSGFIGSHIVDRLVAEGHKVDVLDLWESKDTKTHRNTPNFNFYKGEVTNDELLEKLVKNKDRVIHLAAVLGTSETITTYDVEKTAYTNVVGTVKVLKQARKFSVGRVLVPTTPDVPWINPYKITKAAVEKFVQLFAIEFGLDTVALKLGNIYGARERWLGGVKEAPYNYQKIIPTILVNTLRGEPFDVYGNGEQKSEYIYVADVVESFYRAMVTEKPLNGHIIHVGQNISHSVNDIIDAVEKVWSKKVERNYVPMRPGEVHIEIALKPKLLKDLLDYELQWDLEKGLEQTIPYYEKAI